MPTRAQYRRQLALDLGGFAPKADGSATATGGSTTTLIDTAWPLLTSIDKSTWLDGWYLLRPTAASPNDYVRQIKAGNYVPSTGTITVDNTYTNAVANTHPYELHGHGFEPWYELTELINEGLKLIMIPVQVPYTPQFRTEGNYIQNLTSGEALGITHGSIPGLLHPTWVSRIEVLPYATLPVILFTVLVAPASGTFKFTYKGVSTGVLQWNDNQLTLSLALQTLPGLEEAQCTGTITAGLTVYLKGAPLDTPLLYITSNTMLTGASAGVLFTSQNFTVYPGITKELPARIYQVGGDVLAEFEQHFDPGVSIPSDRLYVTTLVRAYDWCRASATAGFGSQSGVSAEAHEAVPEVEWVSLAAQYYAWERYPHLMDKALDEQRVQSQIECLRKCAAYQAARLRDVQRSTDLTYDVDGDVLQLPFPMTEEDRARQQYALASTARA